MKKKSSVEFQISHIFFIHFEQQVWDFRRNFFYEMK